VISFNRKERYKLDSVGQAIPGVEVRITDEGEVVTRGPHVMKGYWKDPKATAEAIRDGWLHTGDLGRIDEDGFLYITGRKKELLVLSNGKKLVPNEIESLILEEACVDQVVVYGEGRNFLTALIVPNETNLAKEGFAGPPDPRLHAFLERRLAERLKDRAPWERVKKFLVVPEPFSVAREELTVSLKLRRGVIFEHYRPELERLYQE
jgi:long-chain acyl-CoA synthetase